MKNYIKELVIKAFIDKIKLHVTIVNKWVYTLNINNDKYIIYTGGTYVSIKNNDITYATGNNLQDAISTLIKNKYSILGGVDF